MKLLVIFIPGHRILKSNYVNAIIFVLIYEIRRFVALYWHGNIEKI